VHVRERGRRCCQRGRRGGIGRELRQAEIEHFDAVAVCHEQVGGLDVPVDDAAPMGRVERLGNLPREVQDPGGGDRPLLDQLFDRAALEQLHRDEWLTAVFAEFVNRTDVGMLEG
jgi:hypothetical protein